MSSALTWNPDYDGTPNDFDLRAAQLLLDQENEARAKQSPPLPPLSFNKVNILAIVADRASKWWDAWIDQAEEQIIRDQFRARIPISSDAQIAASLAELEPLP